MTAARVVPMYTAISSKAVMTVPVTFVIDSPGDAARAAELRRVKLLATLVLAATFALFIAAKALLHVHPAFGFVAAFAEAATIGGSPTGMPWWRCSAGRWDCRFRTPRSSLTTRTTSG